MAIETPNGKKVGRKTDLTPELQEKIVGYIQGGNYVETAVAAAGIGKTSFYNWMDRGKTIQDQMKADPEYTPSVYELPFVEFVNAIEEAQAKAEALHVAVIQKAAITGTWQASSWWLERTRAKKFARMEKTELTGADGGAVRIDVSTEDLERKVSKVLEKREETQ